VTADTRYTPPLGFFALTPFYDRAIASLTREEVWRSRLARHLFAQPGEVILDVGAGTGSLALLVTAGEPRCIYRGVDPDKAAVSIAERKAALARSHATFQAGTLAANPVSPKERADKIVCSLVLHQVSLAEKRRLLASMFEWLNPGGQLFIADYGAQRGLMRMAFRLTVQLLDGTTDTQPNANGVLPLLIAEAGFESAVMLDAFGTPTGQIEIIRAERPAPSWTEQ
jgi:ubiquinone/menaquinone biosynthesis C-methylase UbiE